MTDIDECRKAFEEWYGSKPEFGNYIYTSVIVQSRWEAWQAAYESARRATPAVGDDEVERLAAFFCEKYHAGFIRNNANKLTERPLPKEQAISMAQDAYRFITAPKQQDGGLVEKIRAAKNPDPKNVGYNQGLETAIEICQQHTAEQSVMGEGDN